MLCRNCGASCADSLTHCDACGFPLNKRPVQEEKRSYERANSDGERTQSSSSSSQKRRAPGQTPSGSNAIITVKEKVDRGFGNFVRFVYARFKKNPTGTKAVLTIVAFVLVLAVMALTVSTCSCLGSACVSCSNSLEGTWVSSENHFDKYYTFDTVFEFTRKGVIKRGGAEIGGYSYEKSAESFEVIMEGMSFMGKLDRESDSLYLYISGTDTLYSKLIRISTRTGLDDGQLKAIT